jgi:ketosteroid isomerase-like protein
MTREEMDRVVEEHFAMEACANIEGILATFTDDVEHDLVGMPGGPLHGKPAAGAFYAALTRELPATDVVPRHRYYGDDVLIDEVVWEARADGRPFGVDGRGRPLSVRLLHVFVFRDGLIARENLWLDWAAFAAQLGALPLTALVSPSPFTRGAAPMPVPTSTDAVTVAPDIYTVLFENERVRVLDVHMAPGQQSAQHSHPDGVWYVLAPMRARFHGADGRAVEAEIPAGAMWRPAETHAAENIGPTAIRAIAVELK